MKNTAAAAPAPKLSFRFLFLLLLILNLMKPSNSYQSVLLFPTRRQDMIKFCSRTFPPSSSSRLQEQPSSHYSDMVTTMRGANQRRVESVGTTDLELSTLYNIPFISSSSSVPNSNQEMCRYLLQKKENNILQLIPSSLLSSSSLAVRPRTTAKPFFLDYQSKVWQNRFKQASQELVVKAIGRENHVMIDLTAGLGRDSLLIAFANPLTRIILIERNPIMFLLLENALQRLFESRPQLKEQITFLHGQANDVSLLSSIQGILQNEKQVLEGKYSEQIRSEDVGKAKRREIKVSVYLDPMYPISAKDRTAQVKKETQILHQVLALYHEEYSEENILECQQNDQLLFETARQLSTHRIVVKRAIHCDPLAVTFKPSHVLKGSNQRFDIYTAINKASEGKESDLLLK